MLWYVTAIAAACFVLERCIPGWTLPRVKSWPVRVVAINLVQLGVVLIAGATWEIWLSSRSVFALSDHLSPVAGGLLAYFIATFVFYWWHRWRHESDVLWRLFHQIHHSPQRIEVITSFYKHPLEMVVNSLIGSVLVYCLLGLSLEAGAVYTACTALGEFFYHTSVRTPRWVGSLFQRPEMHRIHHQYGRHRNNYGDFRGGTCCSARTRIPASSTQPAALTMPRSGKLMHMLAFRDVHATEQEAGRRGASS